MKSYWHPYWQWLDRSLRWESWFYRSDSVARIFFYQENSMIFLRFISRNSYSISTSSCLSPLQIDSALWTRSAVQTLIVCECGVKMPIRTVGEYLKRWGYTPQKPLLPCLWAEPAAGKSLVRHWVPSHQATGTAGECRNRLGWWIRTALRCSSRSRLRTDWAYPRNSTEHATS